MAKKSVAVIGLGQFGRAVVEELVDNGMDVIAMDMDEESVRQVAHLLPTAFVADATDEEALKELGIKDVDVAVVAFGDNQRASVLTTVILKELGVKRIIVRVDNEYYSRVMLKLGATEIIAPQKIAGEGLANRIWNDTYRDFYKLDDKYSIVSIQINPKFRDHTLIEMNASFKFGVSIVLIVNGNTSFVPTGRDKVCGGNTIFCVGTSKDINSFTAWLNDKERFVDGGDEKASKKKKK